MQEQKTVKNKWKIIIIIIIMNCPREHATSDPISYRPPPKIIFTKISVGKRPPQ